MQIGAGQQVVFLQLDLDQALCQTGGVHGGMDLLKQVGKGTDVILVPVRDNNGPNLVLTLENVAHVWNDDVNAQHVAFGEHQTTVHDQQFVVVFNDHHVLADLADAAEGDDSQDVLRQGQLL